MKSVSVGFKINNTEDDNSSNHSSSSLSKELWILRHGQATHNPRAEAAHQEGCSFETFLRLMQEDDSWDSELTELGLHQAGKVYSQFFYASATKFENETCPPSHSELSLLRPRKGLSLFSSLPVVVSSPLSRCLQTADRAAPHIPIRVVHEHFREINGWLLNAKRRSQSDLCQRFPHWDFSNLPPHEHDNDDPLWTPHGLEASSVVAERGYEGLKWLLHKRPEDRILLVTHAGWLRYTLTQHPRVQVQDGRCRNSSSSSDHHCEGFSDLEATLLSSSPSPSSIGISSSMTVNNNPARSMTVNNNPARSSTSLPRESTARFENCELRRYRLESVKSPSTISQSTILIKPDETGNKLSPSPNILLTELDIPNLHRS